MELLGNFFFHYTDNVRYLKANSKRKCIIVKSVRAGLETSFSDPPGTLQGTEGVDVGKGSPEPHRS